MSEAVVTSGKSGPDNADLCLRSLGLRQNPFSMAPDIVNFFSPPRIEAIVVEILQLIETRMGFALLYGDVGLGKTTLSRRILMELDRRGVQTSLVFNTFFQGVELLREINRDFGIAVDDESLPEQMAALNAYLLSQRTQGENCVIIIDDAQNLAVESLELIRQISNMETGIDKIVQIILIGQPELVAKLDLPVLRQLKSRIVLTRSFRSFSRVETSVYVRRKIAASCERDGLEVTDAAIRRVHRATGGSPRRINVVMGRCLYAAVAEQTTRITEEVADIAIKDVGESYNPGKGFVGGRFLAVAAGLITIIVLVAAVTGSLDSLGKRGAAWLKGAAAGGGDSGPMGHASNAPGGAEVPLRKSRFGQITTIVEVPSTTDRGDGQAVKPRVRKFLAAYGLEPFAGDFTRALAWRRLDGVASRILNKTGMRLVELPVVSAAVRARYATLEVARGEKAPNAYLLFWKPKLWRKTSFSVFYRAKDIVELQKALSERGAYHFRIDGLGGFRTTAAIRAFQKRMNLPVNGVPDVATLFMLESVGSGESGNVAQAANTTPAE